MYDDGYRIGLWPLAVAFFAHLAIIYIHSWPKHNISIPVVFVILVYYQHWKNKENPSK